MTSTAVATELMNRMYRRQRHVYDATRKYYLLGRDDLIAGLRPEANDRVLEIGCGTGRNLILAAQNYPGAKFFGIDVSTAMLTTAIDKIARTGLSSRVRVAHGEATAFNPAMLFGMVQFQRVFLSYCLSMIPGWCAVLNRAASLVAPGGELHIIDFGPVHELPPWCGDGLRRWLALFDVSPCDDLESYLALLAGQRNASMAVTRPYRGYAQHAVVRLPR
jgi:S-adenosylmethionine-diacylgycerolhomoserine-N-methlytransferase